MQQFHQPIAAWLGTHLSLAPESVESLLETPPDPTLGDIALPCFTLAKSMRKAPGAIAQELAAALDAGPYGASATAAGPYLNIHLDRAQVAQELLTTILGAPERYGTSDYGGGQTVCIDFCSPNVARNMHLGHLRSTVIGKALSRLHEAMGYKVVKINFLGDWGTQFGKLIAGWLRFGDPAAAEQDAIAELQRVYVQFHQASEQDPTLVDEARAWFKRLEDGDAEARALWTWIREKSLACMQRTLSLLEVTFDDYTGEAFYEDRNHAVVDLLRQSGILTESDGAQVVELEGLPPALILKADGATLYTTRDLAAALHRQELYQPARSLYVVDMGQSIHFQQVFGVLKRRGLPWAEGLEHVGFGIMRVGGKRLRTRQGDVVYLEDVLAQSVNAARAEVEVRSPGLRDAEGIARAVGVGAVIFNDLKQHRQKDIDYNPAEAVSFDGETGPYVQYAHARCRSVLSKAGKMGLPVPGAVTRGSDQPAGDVPDLALATHGLDEPLAWALLQSLSAFPASVSAAAQRCEPHVLARSVLDIAKALNRFYHEVPVLKADPAVRGARLALVAATAATLKRGLHLLGLQAPPMRAE